MLDALEKMIELMWEESRKNSNAIGSHVCNVCEMESFGEFDMVMATWLFRCIKSLDDLKKDV